MIIRRFRNGDAQEIHKIIKDCFLKLDLGKHTKEGIVYQIENNSPEKLIKRTEKINYFVAEIDGKLVGICGYDQIKIHTHFLLI